MSLVIHPTYFPNILFFSKILNQDKILFEVNDNYIKQSQSIIDKKKPNTYTEKKTKKKPKK